MIAQLPPMVKRFKPTNFRPPDAPFFDNSFILLYEGKNPLFFTQKYAKIYVEILCSEMTIFVVSTHRKPPGKEYFLCTDTMDIQDITMEIMIVEPTGFG